MTYLTVHLAEIDALRARIEQLENELQHKREIIGHLLDRQATQHAEQRAAQRPWTGITNL